MKEDLLKLVDLQNLDTKIYNIKNDLEKLPIELQKLLDEFNPALEKYESNKDLLKKQEAENLKFKLELEENSSILKTLQDRLSKVRNAKELSAIDKEINGVKKTINAIEDKNIKLLDDIDNLKKESSEENQIISEQQKHLDELKQQIEKKKNETSNELKSLEHERTKIANTLPPDLLDKYEFIFNKRDKKAIVPIKDEICTGCYMSIPPQVVSDVKKGFKIFYCQYCSRMLYYPEWES